MIACRYIHVIVDRIRARVCTCSNEVVAIRCAKTGYKKLKNHTNESRKIMRHGGDKQTAHGIIRAKHWQKSVEIMKA